MLRKIWCTRQWRGQYWLRLFEQLRNHWPPRYGLSTSTFSIIVLNGMIKKRSEKVLTITIDDDALRPSLTHFIYI